jgi:hypothetical protein
MDSDKMYTALDRYKQVPNPLLEQSPEQVDYLWSTWLYWAPASDIAQE